MEEFQKNLKEAIKHLQIADHMTYVTLQILNEQKLIIKIFDEIYNSIIQCINAILNYEYLYRKISPSQENNLNTFIKIAKDYNINNEQIKKIKEIINLNKQHKQSAMEFVKKDKVIILSDSLRTQTLNIRLIKEYLLLAKELLAKVSGKTKM